MLLTAAKIQIPISIFCFCLFPILASGDVQVQISVEGTSLPKQSYDLNTDEYYELVNGVAEYRRQYQYYDFPFGQPVRESLSITSYGGDYTEVNRVIDFLATFYSSGLATADINGNLGISLLTSVNGTTAYGPNDLLNNNSLKDAVAQVSVNWNDSYYINGSGALPFNTILFNGTISGTINGTGATSTSSLAASAVAAFPGFQLFEIFDTPVSATAGYQWSTEGPTSGNVFWGLNVGARTFDGSMLTDFSNSMELTSITFPDGSTPESHGFDIVFESGMISPNIRNVPEPTSFALFGIALLGLSLRRRQR